MKLSNCSTAIFVKDIKISKEFYTGLLEMEIDLDFGKNVIFKNGFAIWEIQENHIIPLRIGLKKISDQSVNRFELYFETENITEIFEALKNRKINFLHELNEETWGQRTIRFYDPDCHLIEIGESVRQFVRRLYEQGLTVGQVMERTSLPLEEVQRLIS